jgi:hypothetical protein
LPAWISRFLCRETEFIDAPGALIFEMEDRRIQAGFSREKGEAASLRLLHEWEGQAFTARCSFRISRILVLMPRPPTCAFRASISFWLIETRSQARVDDRGALGDHDRSRTTRRRGGRCPIPSSSASAGHAVLRPLRPHRGSPGSPRRSSRGAPGSLHSPPLESAASLYSNGRFCGRKVPRGRPRSGSRKPAARNIG